MAKKSEKRERREFEGMWDEIEKMAKRLRRGEFDAFEMYGTTLRGSSENSEQVDKHMAVLFQLPSHRAPGRDFSLETLRARDRLPGHATSGAQVAGGDHTDRVWGHA